MLAESGLGGDVQRQMAEFAIVLNAEYFSGKRVITADHPAWTLWQEHLPGSFFTYYMSSILAEPTQDMTYCSFEETAQ